MPAGHLQQLCEFVHAGRLGDGRTARLTMGYSAQRQLVRPLAFLQTTTRTVPAYAFRRTVGLRASRSTVGLTNP